MIQLKQLTIIIPIYRKSKSFFDYFNDLKKLNLYDFQKINFILSLNSVEDFDPNQEILRNENVSYFIHSCTLSIGENWISCIEKVKTPYFKINSSNDPIEIKNIVNSLSLIDGVDLLVGKTRFINLSPKWSHKVNFLRQKLVSIKDSSFFFSQIIWENNLGDISGYIFKTELLLDVIKRRRRTYLHGVHNYPDYSLILYGLIRSQSIRYCDLEIGHYVADIESPVMSIGIDKSLFYLEYETFRLTNYLFNRHSEERQIFRLSFLRIIFVLLKLFKKLMNVD